MSLRDNFVLDKDAQANGVWFDVADEGGKILASFKCRRAHASLPNIAKAYRERGQALRPDLDWGDLSDDEARSIQVGVYASEVIVDWKGVSEYDLDPEGSRDAPAPYSPEACERLLGEMPELLATLVGNAMSREHYSAARRQMVAGNS